MIPMTVVFQRPSLSRPLGKSHGSLWYLRASWHPQNPVGAFRLAMLLNPGLRRRSLPSPQVTFHKWQSFGLQVLPSRRPGSSNPALNGLYQPTVMLLRARHSVPPTRTDYLWVLSNVGVHPRSSPHNWDWTPMHPAVLTVLCTLPYISARATSASAHFQSDSQLRRWLADKKNISTWIISDIQILYIIQLKEKFPSNTVQCSSDWDQLMSLN